MSKINERTARELMLLSLTNLHEASSKDDRLLALSLDLLEEAKELYGITETEVSRKVKTLEKRRK